MNPYWLILMEPLECHFLPLWWGSPPLVEGPSVGKKTGQKKKKKIEILVSLSHRAHHSHSRLLHKTPFLSWDHMTTTNKGWQLRKKAIKWKFGELYFSWQELRGVFLFQLVYNTVETFLLQLCRKFLCWLKRLHLLLLASILHTHTSC